MKQKQPHYMVVSSSDKNFVMAAGFFGEAGRVLAERRIAEGYFNRHLQPQVKDTKFIVIEN